MVRHSDLPSTPKILSPESPLTGSLGSEPAAIQSNHVDIPLYSSLQMRQINNWCNRIPAVRSRWMICAHKRPANAAIVFYGCYFSGD